MRGAWWGWDVSVHSTIIRAYAHAAGARRRGDRQVEPPGGSMPASRPITGWVLSGTAGEHAASLTASGIFVDLPAVRGFVCDDNARMRPAGLLGHRPGRLVPSLGRRGHDLSDVDSRPGPAATRGDPSRRHRLTGQAVRVRGCPGCDRDPRPRPRRPAAARRPAGLPSLRRPAAAVGVGRHPPGAATRWRCGPGAGRVGPAASAAPVRRCCCRPGSCPAAVRPPTSSAPPWPLPRPATGTAASQPSWTAHLPPSAAGCAAPAARLSRVSWKLRWRSPA